MLDSSSGRSVGWVAIVRLCAHVMVTQENHVRTKKSSCVRFIVSLIARYEYSIAKIVYKFEICNGRLLPKLHQADDRR